MVGKYLARWMYKKNIPFNAVNDDDFKQFCEALGRFGPKWKPPSQYMLREKMLLQEVERTKDLMKPHELERVETGCSIMTDAWTDKKRRSIMNLCVHCKYSSSCDVLLGEGASTAQDWICEDAYIDDEMGATEDDNAMEPHRSLRVRELHEVEECVCDDESDIVPINEDEIEFESDDDVVGNGIEETSDNGEADRMEP